MAICEDVFRMHARHSVRWSAPPSQKLDVGAPFHNHWHVKTAILEDEPIAGVRLYSYFDDGMRNTVGRLDCARYIVLADPATGRPLAIVDEHWTYAIRSAAAAMVALKWLGPKRRAGSGLVGVGTMGENCLRCLRHSLPLRGDHLPRVARRAAGLRGEMVEDARHPGSAARQRRGGRAQFPHRVGGDPHRHRQPRAVGPGATFVSLAARDGPGGVGPASTRPSSTTGTAT
jgi:ornithine cyclodeaminase/alanine dehydrogenase-like protein (mu-crystallin family)